MLKILASETSSYTRTDLKKNILNFQLKFYQQGYILGNYSVTKFLFHFILDKLLQTTLELRKDVIFTIL